MQFELEQRFCGSVEAVAALYSDPRLLERLAQTQAVCRAELLERSDKDGVVRQRVRYAYTGAVSPKVRAMVDPSSLTWVEESEVDRRTHRRRFRIVPEHHLDRLRCEGTVELEADGEATRRVTQGELEVRFPVVGSQMAEAIVSGLRQFSVAEAAVVQEWLDELSPENSARPSEVRRSDGAAATGTSGSPLEGLLREYREGWLGTIQGIERFVGGVRDTISGAIDAVLGRRC